MKGGTERSQCSVHVLALFLACDLVRVRVLVLEVHLSSAGSGWGAVGVTWPFSARFRARFM